MPTSGQRALTKKISLLDLVQFEFVVQRLAIDTQHLGRLALVACATLQSRYDLGPLALGVVQGGNPIPDFDIQPQMLYPDGSTLR